MRSRLSENRKMAKRRSDVDYVSINTIIQLLNEADACCESLLALACGVPRIRVATRTSEKAP